MLPEDGDEGDVRHARNHGNARPVVCTVERLRCEGERRSSERGITSYGRQVSNTQRSRAGQTGQQGHEAGRTSQDVTGTPKTRCL